MREFLDNIFEPQEFQLSKSKAAKRARRPAARNPKYPPDTDIELWLKDNAPATFHELVDLRYALYHRRSRASFTVNKYDKDDFILKGRCGSLHFINNKARHYLLWKLRLLARRRKWRGAIPQKVDSIAKGASI